MPMLVPLDADTTTAPVICSEHPTHVAATVRCRRANPITLWDQSERAMRNDNARERAGEVEIVDL